MGQSVFIDNIEIIYNVRNVQLIKPEYEFQPPYSY